MKYRAIITDVGGVLVRTLSDKGRKKWEKKLHLKTGELTKEVHRKKRASQATIGLIEGEMIWQEIKRKYKLSDEDFANFIVDFNDGDELNLKFYNYILSKRKNYKTVILTNAWANVRSGYIRKYHLDKIVDQMFISGELGMKKPDPGIYKYVLKNLGTLPQETIFIDDEKRNVKTAKKIGIQTVLFTDTESAIREIDSLTDPTKNSASLDVSSGYTR